MSESPIYLICPSIPNLCVNISPYEDLETVEDAWRTFGDYLPKLSYVGATLVESSNKEKDISLSTRICDLKKESKSPKIITISQASTGSRLQFHYRIEGLSAESGYGNLSLLVNETYTMFEIAHHILLRHRLINDISDPIISHDFILGVDVSKVGTQYFSLSKVYWSQKLSYRKNLRLRITKGKNILFKFTKYYRAKV